jgi:hypothetical protein
MVAMIVRTRILTGSILLPGCFPVRVLDLNQEGQLVTITDTVPSRVNLQTLLAKLEMRSPRLDIYDNCIITPMRQKLTAIVKCGRTEHRERAKGISEAIEMVLREGANDDAWAYKLWTKTGKSSVGGDAIDKWTRLQTSEALELLVAGARAGRLPGLMRVTR